MFVGDDIIDAPVDQRQIAHAKLVAEQASGADPEAIRECLRAAGIDPGGL